MASLLVLAALMGSSGLRLHSPLLETGTFAREPPALLAQASPPPAAPTSRPASYDVIRTRDGKVRVGKILDDTDKGYLVRTSDGESMLIAYEEVDDVQRTGGSLGARPAPPPPTVYAPPPPGYPQYPYDPGRVERDLKRVRLEASLRDLESRYSQLSYTGAVITTVVGTAMVVLALTFLGGLDNPNGAILLVIGGIEVLVGGIQLGVTAWDRAELAEQLESTRAELEQLTAHAARTLRAPMITLARF